MIQHLQNSLPVLILSTPYSVLEYSMLSTGVFHTMYWSIPYYVLEYSILCTAVFHTKYWRHSTSALETPKGIYIVFVTMLAVAAAYSPEEWKEIFGRMED